MDRRSFLTKAAVGGTAAAAASTLAAPRYAQGNRTLTLVTTWSRGLAGVHDAAQRCADTITAMTDGQLTVDLKAAGELVGAFEVFDAVTSGQADMYHGADYYFVGQHPGYAFFTSVPMGMTAQELANWYYHGGGMELHDELGQIFRRCPRVPSTAPSGSAPGPTKRPASRRSPRSTTPPASTSRAPASRSP